MGQLKQICFYVTFFSVVAGEIGKLISGDSTFFELSNAKTLENALMSKIEESFGSSFERLLHQLQDPEKAGIKDMHEKKSKNFMELSSSRFPGQYF